MSELKAVGPYPFSEGDDYWVVENGRAVWGCWDEESARLDVLLDKPFIHNWRLYPPNICIIGGYNRKYLTEAEALDLFRAESPYIAPFGCTMVPSAEHNTKES